MEKLRRAAVWVAALYWACCLGLHVVVVITRPWPVPGSFYVYVFLLTGTVAIAALNLTKPAGPDWKEPAPHWYFPALVVAGLICGLWPMVVGSGVPNNNIFRSLFEDSGVPGGPPGDRSLDSHGRRVRALTEEEFQQAEAWQAVVWTGVMAGFSGMTLAGALYFQQARRTPNPSLQQAAAAVLVSGTSLAHRGGGRC